MTINFHDSLAMVIYGIYIYIVILVYVSAGYLLSAGFDGRRCEVRYLRSIAAGQGI